MEMVVMEMGVSCTAKHRVRGKEYRVHGSGGGCSVTEHNIIINSKLWFCGIHVKLAPISPVYPCVWIGCDVMLALLPCGKISRKVTKHALE